MRLYLIKRDGDEPVWVEAPTLPEAVRIWLADAREEIDEPDWDGEPDSIECVADVAGEHAVLRAAQADALSVLRALGAPMRENGVECRCWCNVHIGGPMATVHSKECLEAGAICGPAR